MDCFKGSRFVIFAAGVLFGTAGVKLLTSRDAKKAYTHTTAAVLRAKESVMTTVTKAREEMDDILADAKDINDVYATEGCIVEDAAASEETTHHEEQMV